MTHEYFSTHPHIVFNVHFPDNYLSGNLEVMQRGQWNKSRSRHARFGLQMAETPQPQQKLQ